MKLSNIRRGSASDGTPFNRGETTRGLGGVLDGEHVFDQETHQRQRVFLLLAFTLCLVLVMGLTIVMVEAYPSMLEQPVVRELAIVCVDVYSSLTDVLNLVM